MEQKRPKRKRKNVRHTRFLMNLANGMDIGDSYLQAGFNPKSKENASKCGSELLKKLESSMDYREILASRGVTEGKVAEVMKELLTNEDAHVRARTLAIATKCLGWQREIVPENELADIIILKRTYPKGRKDAEGEVQEEKDEVLKISE